MSNKSIDFSKGIRGKHAQMNLKIVGAVEQVWAICVSKNAQDFIPFKVYKIETSDKSEKANVVNEKGKIVSCPKKWFIPVDISVSVQKILEKAI